MYKAATSFADLGVFRNQIFDVASGTRVLKGLPATKSGDIVNGVMKGSVTFRYPAPSAPAAASAVPVGGQVSGATSGAASSSASPGLRRSPRRLRQVLVAHARSDVLEGDLDPVDTADRPLSEAERSVYSEVMRWNGPESSLSRRTSSGVCTELPAVLVMAAQVYRFWCFSAQLYSAMFSLIGSFHERITDIRDREHQYNLSTNAEGKRSCPPP